MLVYIWLVVPTDVIPMTQRTGRQELTNRVPGNEAGPSTSLISRPSRGEGKNVCLGLLQNKLVHVLYMATACTYNINVTGGTLSL